MTNPPLSGTLIVEIGARIAAGGCGSLLAQLGAETVLVEAPAREGFAGAKWRHRAAFAAGKLSFRPDPQDADDLELFRRLVARCDAVITSSDADGALTQALGEGWAADKIVCDVTAYGHTGPRAGRPDSEWQVQALAGITETTGMADGPPVPIALPLVESMTGVYAAAAVVAALRVRRLSGAGQVIDMALYDCAFAAMATFLPSVLAGGREPVNRAGNHHAMISPWNVYAASDGWILVCAGTDAQWRRLCDVMGRPDLGGEARYAAIAERVARRGEVDAIVQEWAGERTVEDCAGALNQAAIASGAIVPIAPYPREANLDHRDMIRRLADPVEGGDVFFAGSPIRMSDPPGRAPERVPAPDEDRKRVRALAEATPGKSAPPCAPEPPLAGVRVVEIGHYTTAPLSARHMGALGAEVIKIEPPDGEATRGWLPAQRGQGYFFTYTNSDKRSLVLDLQSEEGAETLRELLAGADVLIENLKPGALARRGFSADELAAINPRLVYCAVSGFGHDSLYAGRPAYDSVVQAMSGIMDDVRADDVPVKTGISIADLLGAQAALLGVLAALEQREHTGRGQFVDISMQDVAAWMTQTAWNDRTQRNAAPCLIRCSDGHVVAGETAEALKQLAGKAITEQDGTLCALMARAELVALLAENGIAAAPVLSVHEAVAAPQTAARSLYFTVEADGETWPLMASPLRLAATPPRVRDPMPALGRDNDAILAALRRRHAGAADVC